MLKALRACGNMFMIYLQLQKYTQRGPFFNYIDQPNNFPSLIILNVKKLIYWANCNKVPITIKMVKNNLVKFLLVQLEIYRMGEKKDELNKIWKSIMRNNLKIQHKTDKFVTSIRTQSRDWLSPRLRGR